MVKLSRKALEKIQAQLELIDDSHQSEFSLKEIVREFFYLIETARSYKASWEDIAKIIKTAGELEQGVSPATISKYYLELKKNPESLPKKKRKTGGSKTPKLAQEPPQSDSEPEQSKVIQSERDADAVVEQNFKPEIHSQFNLGRIGK